MKELSINYQEIPWEQAPGYPSGTLMKVLRRDEKGHTLTVLLKLGEGFEMEGHSHIGTEQHFVLEGEYESEGRIYPTGSYRMIPSETSHGPFKSEKGAVIFVAWDAR
jgi:anti-sigma factor ChrR (cupin superfamily)